MTAKFCALVLSGLLGMLASEPVYATAIYSYTGNNFVFATPPYTVNDHLSIQLEFPTELAPNLPFGSVSPTNFSFNDGHQTITFPGLTAVTMLSTNASGNILEWELTVCGNVGCDHAIVSRNTTLAIRDGGQLTPQGVQEGLVDNNPGIWISTSYDVPEPSTFVLGSAALACLAGVRRRRPARMLNRS